MKYTDDVRSEIRKLADRLDEHIDEQAEAFVNLWAEVDSLRAELTGDGRTHSPATPTLEPGYYVATHKSGAKELFEVKESLFVVIPDHEGLFSQAEYLARAVKVRKLVPEGS